MTERDGDGKQDGTKTKGNLPFPRNIIKRILIATRKEIMICAACGILIAVIIGVIVFFVVKDDASKEPTNEREDNGEPWFMSKSLWHALPVTDVYYLNQSQEFVVIAHTASGFCRIMEYCTEEVRNMQLAHMHSLNMSDIAYNFVVGGDGRVYEGAGWRVRGAHTAALNSRALGVAFIGDYRSSFQNSSLTPRQIANAQRLLREGVENGGLRENYTLVAHCQVTTDNESPGDNVYNVIKEWDHFPTDTLDQYNVCSWKEASITGSGSDTVLPASVVLLVKLLVASSLLTALLTLDMY